MDTEIRLAPNALSTSNDIPSPCFVLEEDKLVSNLELLAKVKKESGCEVLLALKGFSMKSAADLVSAYLDGVSASSLNEVRLGEEYFTGTIHAYSPAYLPVEIEAIAKASHHLTFNSLSQYQQHAQRVKGLNPNLSLGLRINPGYSVVETDLYNPCVAGSRLGVGPEHLSEGLPEGIEGFHSHNLCESGTAALVETLHHIEQRYAEFLPKLKWLNLGGGHAITREGYDVEMLIATIKSFSAKYDLKVILEPGSAIAWQTGVLVSTVIDIVENQGVRTAMLDVSFAAHMPDCLEMPYKPAVKGEQENGTWEYRLGGGTCLAGDYVTGFKFPKPLDIGDRLVFQDMMHYTMVKTNTFNGVNLPNIGHWTKNGEFKLVSTFGYEDFKRRI